MILVKLEMPGKVPFDHVVGIKRFIASKRGAPLPQRGLHKCCWLRLWIVLRLWMSGVFQLLGTLRNKLRRTLRHLRQQLRHSLRASEIRLRRTIRTDFLLRVPATLVIGVTDRVADERVIVPARGNPPQSVPSPTSYTCYRRTLARSGANRSYLYSERFRVAPRTRPPLGGRLRTR